MKNSELIEDLITKTKNHLERTEQFLKLPEEKLSENDLEKWNILQCCEHLNLYFDFYLPMISKKLKKKFRQIKNLKAEF